MVAIPLGFNEYFPDPLPITVDLLDYSGRSWTVRMKKIGENVFLTLGWENFVKDNNLEDGKYLNFIYDCDRTFYVIIFAHDMCSEFRGFPQVIVDVDDYETCEDEDEDVEEAQQQKENNK
ncbi:hypothetical protein CARUB_v10012547mg [Capsella rubella]|uniref:TF-B3 domain-containing protein n=1 Tax=Capsella rubella TaxID=81985 RepID=R0GU12_9BRAS|nr:hypothetical protein CARUB_v10012547mg [Capsella rubella]